MRRWWPVAGSAALVVVALGYGTWVKWPDLARYPADSLLYVAVGAGYVLTGVLLRAEPEQRGTGWLFVATGFAWLSNSLNIRWSGPFPMLGWFAMPIDELLLLVILMRYPYRRIADRFTRRIVAAAVTIVFVLNLASGLTWSPTWGHWPIRWWTIVPLRHVQPHLWFAYQLAGLLTTVVAIALVARRLRRSAGLNRRELMPVALTTVVLAINIGIRLTIDLFTGSEDVPEPVWIPSEVLLLLAPVAFAGTAIRRRLDRLRAVELVTGVAQPATVESVRDALRAALGDPGLEVLIWLPEPGRYADSAGRTAEPDRPDALRRDVRDAAGEPLAAVLIDPSLYRRDDVVDVALRAASLSLQNARLHADLLARLTDLRESRARVVEAGVTERRRVERDLHDGAQQQLLALATTLGRVHAAAEDPQVRQLTDQARTELRRALRDLRDLARGIHPAVLEQVGLAAAVDSVAESLPLRVDVRVEAPQLPKALETILYFVICEALANVVKHAGATRASIDVQQAGGVVRAVVADDGTGGARVVPGGGLGGLADRVAALGGRLDVHSPAGDGTRLVVELPCG